MISNTKILICVTGVILMAISAYVAERKPVNDADAIKCRTNDNLV
jgi:hypothetical protein